MFYKFLKQFQKLLVNTCLLNVPPTEILATPLQYITWEEIMYEILSDVPPPEPKSYSSPWTYVVYIYIYIYNLVHVIVSHV